MRTYEESCHLLDGIVGRCVREETFGSLVLHDPDAALQEYGLSEEELDDFRALKAKHQQTAGEVWAELRESMQDLQTVPDYQI